MFSLLLRRLMMLTLGLCLAACSTQPPHAYFEAQAVNYLNPDAQGRPSPVVVSIYELSHETAFKSASYSQLYTQADEVLGNQLLDRHQIEIRPNEQRFFNEPLSPNTRYLGFVAGFRNINLADWKLWIPMSEDAANINLKLLLETQSLVVQQQKKGWL